MLLILLGLACAAGARGGLFDGALGSFVGGHAFREGVAVDAKLSRRARQVIFIARERLLDVKLLKFGEGFVEHYLSVEHFIDKGFEAGAHLHNFSGRLVE